MVESGMSSSIRRNRFGLQQVFLAHPADESGEAFAGVYLWVVVQDLAGFGDVGV